MGMSCLPMTPGFVTMSTRPPAATATTARPDAMASRATKPSVSVSLGIMKMSADAYAADSSSPRSIPYVCTRYWLHALEHWLIKWPYIMPSSATELGISASPGIMRWARGCPLLMAHC